MGLEERFPTSRPGSHRDTAGRSAERSSAGATAWHSCPRSAECAAPGSAEQQRRAERRSAAARRAVAGDTERGDSERRQRQRLMSTHTHWTRTLPSRWFLCTLLLASSCAILCSSARHLDPFFCINLCGCVFSLQARRALRATSRKQGWIQKSRSAGGRRCKGHRRQKARRRLRAALQIPQGSA